MTTDIEQKIYKLILKDETLLYNNIIKFHNIKYIWLKLYPEYKLSFNQTKNIIKNKLYQSITDKINILIDIQKKLPNQRTKEWYLMRHNMITASDLYKVIGTPSAKRDLLIQKSSLLTENKNISRGKACNHGIKYEKIALLLYELRNKVNVLDFGCIPHLNNNIPFGASPDGICDLSNNIYAGRMLEIKCPYSREINGRISDMYWKQVQGQLEVCNLEECDFLECKITEYNDCNEFYMDGNEIKRENNLEKGLIIIYSENEIYNYIYASIGLSKIELNNFIDKQKEYILKDKNKIYIGLTWWKLEMYSCILIKRDREWFKSILPSIYSFWEQVELFRIKGNNSLKKEIKKKKVKEYLNIDICLID